MHSIIIQLSIHFPSLSMNFHHISATLFNLSENNKANYSPKNFFFISWTWWSGGGPSGQTKSISESKTSDILKITELKNRLHMKTLPIPSTWLFAVPLYQTCNMKTGIQINKLFNFTLKNKIFLQRLKYCKLFWMKL